MSLNVAATSTSNKKLNSAMNECIERTSCSVSKRSNEDERGIFLTYTSFYSKLNS